ncbi:hypothetical protein SYNPS1DRAFT_14302, partial [Syncephalis pseudoplumigaleata]
MPHYATGVMKMHSVGVKGAQVKIGIIGTGVQYEHPALARRFGPGNKAVFGYDFVGDHY